MVFATLSVYSVFSVANCSLNPDKYPKFRTVKVKLPWSGGRKDGKIRVLKNSQNPGSK